MGLSMGGNAWRVRTKLSPCRQSPVSVAYYLPLCVSFVTKCWAMGDFQTWLITQVTAARGAGCQFPSELPACPGCSVYNSQV